MKRVISMLIVVIILLNTFVPIVYGDILESGTTLSITTSTQSNLSNIENPGNITKLDIFYNKPELIGLENFTNLT